MDKYCSICGDLKFEIFTQDSSYFRCLNCQKSLTEVLKINEVKVEGDKNE